MPNSKWKWVKMPSTTVGGKSWFYTAMTTKGRIFVAWERHIRGWCVRLDKTTKNEAVCLTRGDGQYFVERNFEPAVEVKEERKCSYQVQA